MLLEVVWIKRKRGELCEAFDVVSPRNHVVPKHILFHTQLDS